MDLLEFNSKIRFSMSWNSLKYKNEYNINSDEFSLYQMLADNVGLIALNLRLNHILCEVLARLHGFVFCNNGINMWNIIEEYLNINNINVSVNELKYKVTLRKIRNIAPDMVDILDKYIYDMYSLDAKTKEAKLVLECYKIIKSLQPLKNNDILLYYDLTDDALKELKEKSIEAKDIISIDISKYIPNNMDSFIDKLPTDIKLECFDNISEYIDQYKNENKYSFDDALIIGISCFIDD